MQGSGNDAMTHCMPGPSTPRTASSRSSCKPIGSGISIKGSGNTLQLQALHQVADTSKNVAATQRTSATAQRPYLVHGAVPAAGSEASQHI